MSALLQTAVDDTPLPTSSSSDKNRTMYANTPTNADDIGARDASDTNDSTPQNEKYNMHTPTYSAPFIDTTSPANAAPALHTQPLRDTSTLNNATTLVSPDTSVDSNVYLQIARVLLVVVIMLSIVYFVYWIMQNIYDIDPLETVGEWLSNSPLSNFSKPLNELTTSAAVAGTVAIGSTLSAQAADTANVNANDDGTQLSQPTPLHQQQMNHEHVRSVELPQTTQSQRQPYLPQTEKQQKALSTFSSLFAPLQNLFHRSESNRAPHKDGVFVHPQQTPMQGPLTEEGTQMKKTLSDKSVSVLLDLMSKIN